MTYQPLSQPWKGFLKFFLKRVVLILTLMFCVGVGIALANMSRLSSSLIESQGVQNAALYIESFNQAIDLYSAAAADRAQTKGVEVTHAYLNEPGAIPLPSTFAIELGDRISDRKDAMMVRLYSDYPFPFREGGGPHDAFEREALTYLRQNPKDQFFRREQNEGQPILRYAEPSIMKPTCVTCHNTHPNSLKTDWRVGDVAGVWEIGQP